MVTKFLQIWIHIILAPFFHRILMGILMVRKNQKTQTRYMQDAGYMRLKNLQIGYSLPSTWMHKIGISKCRVYVSGENLLTFTSLSDIFDPETATGVAGGNTYPLSRTWSFGLSVTL